MNGAWAQSAMTADAFRKWIENAYTEIDFCRRRLIEIRW